MSVLKRYGLAALVTLAFLLGARALFALISYNPVIFVITNIIAVSWLYGRGPGIFASFMVVLLARPIFYPQLKPFSFDAGDYLRLLLYLALAGFVSYLVGARQKAEAALMKTNAELDQRVQARTAELAAANEDLRRSNEALIEERARVEQVNEALRRANRDLEHFAYSASHDLQEPIRSVGIFSELIAEHYGSRMDDEGRRYLQFVREGAIRMERLVRGLLEYTRIPNGDGAARYADANRALEKAMETLSRTLQDSNARVVNQGLPELAMHELHLQQVFQNLIGNAVKYRSEKSPEIVISADPQEDGWRFAVADNGIGIGPDYRDQIFGLFKRLHQGEKYPGTGLGLAICRRIVEQYGGRIWVESKEGSGSTFYFTIQPQSAKAAEGAEMNAA